ncbi:MAG TPA: hypothetical protein VI819_01955 [Patescibacteria group bacterium]|nr:hypothetical protein [Patescibacteria group bacterium]
MSKNHKFPTDEIEFNKFLVREYMKYGTVDEVYRKHKYFLPISYANYQRVLDRWDIKKAVGPNNKFSEAVDFLGHLAKDNIAFEKLYKKLPPNYKTSAVTLYRVLAYVKEGITRRLGTALVITPYDNINRILVARDVSTPRIQLGKTFGSYSIPMGYSKKGESRSENIKRILQQEVFTDKSINREFPEELVSESLSPFMYLEVADIRVSVYHIQLPKDLSSEKVFSSYKLQDFEFVPVTEVLGETYNGVKIRSGVKDALKGYLKYLKLLERKLTINPLQEKSIMNKELATVTIEVEE